MAIPDEKPASGWLLVGRQLVQKAWNAFFTPPQDLFSHLIATAWFVALVLGSVAIWGLFFSWGNIAFDFHDWAEVTGPRYALLRDAAQRGIFPLHAGNTTALRLVTDRYLSIPDTPISPQYLLLRFVNLGQYIFLDTLFFYLIGSFGLFLFYRKYHLSPFVLTVVFLLFNFNGSIINHLAIGHSIWVGYFLLPYFVLLVFQLIEQQRAGWKWVLGMSIFFVVLLLQGSFHFYIWCLIFLGVLALFNLRLLKPVLLAGIFSVLTALPRLLPPVLSLQGLKHEYLGGFTSVTDLVLSLVIFGEPNRSLLTPVTDSYPIGWWELNYFVGLLGFAYLVIFAIYLPLRHNRAKDGLPLQILVPSLVLTALSIGKVYWFVMKLVRLPPFTGERVTARFFILVLAFLILLGAIYLQRAMYRSQPGFWTQAVGFLLAGVMYQDLYAHLRSWRIRYIDGLTNLLPKMPFDPAQHTIANHPDPIYTSMIIGGAIVSLGAFAFLIWMVVGERKRAVR